MATSNSPTSATGQSGEYKSRAFTGDLPAGFLQLEEQGPSGIAQTGQGPSGIVQQQHVYGPSVPMHTVKRLSITISQAKLAKNYGLTRMDPYCRIRVGHHVFETPTAANASVNPRWNKTVTCPVMKGVNAVYVEVFDECAFSTDSQIAWGLVKVKEEVLNGETVDDWYPLSGKQGEDKEGMVNIILSCRETTEPVPVAPVMIFPQAYTVPPQLYYPPMPFAVPQQLPPPQRPAQCPAPVQIQPHDVQNIKDMFPDMDEEVIRSVLEASGGNVEAALNHLLSMNEKINACKYEQQTLSEFASMAMAMGSPRRR